MVFRYEISLVFTAAYCEGIVIVCLREDYQQASLPISMSSVTKSASTIKRWRGEE